MRYKPEKIKPGQTWQSKIGQKKRQEPNVISPFFLTSRIDVTQLNGLTQLLMLAAIGSLVGSSLAALPDNSCQSTQTDSPKNLPNVNTSLSNFNNNQTSTVLEEIAFSSQSTDNFQPPLLRENDVVSSQKSDSKQKIQPSIKNGKTTFFKPMTEKLLVKCLPNLQKSIQTLSNQNFLKAKKMQDWVDEGINQVEKMISKLSIDSVIYDKLQKSRLFIFIARNEDLAEIVGEARGGFYAADWHAITINYDILLNSERMLEHVLRNEFHHAIVSTINRESMGILPGKTSMVVDTAQPYLDRNGNLVQQKIGDLQLAIKQFLNNMNKFKRWHEQEKRSQKIALKNMNLFKKMKEVIIDVYQPIEHFAALTPDMLHKISKSGLAMIENNHLKIPKELLPDSISDIWIHLDETKKGQNRIQYRFFPIETPANRLLSFIYDWQAMHLIYTLGDYAQLSDVDKLTELSSDIDTLPGKIKNIFAPKWCEYFKDYLKLEDYCDRTMANKM